MNDSPGLRTFGVDVTTGRPQVLSVPPAMRSRLAAMLAKRPRPPRYGVASPDLASAGWGVVFPESVATEVRDALTPLLAHRRCQAGERYRELTYRPGERTTDFRGRLRAGLGRVDPRQVPWYLLLIGEPEDLPHAFELDLDVPHAVGRLAFEHPEDYAAYAERAVASEDRAGRRPLHALVFAPTHPDDPPTAASRDELARPLADFLEDRGARTTAILGEEASRARLLEHLARDLDLAVLAGHSSIFPDGHSSQRRRQGALLCADWPGPEQWPEAVPPDFTVAGEDLPPGVLRDGLALLFGCHTAGTPHLDVYDGEGRDAARPLTSRPFVAGMAKKLLGRDGAALAAIGHVGRAFEESFLWGGVRQLGAFEDVLHAALEGRRLGEACDGFGQRFADLAVTWASSKMGMDGTSYDPLELWIAFHDARSWALLGDPAIRLPAAAPTAHRPGASTSP